MRVCAFCNIAAGTATADVVYEDELIIAFLDVGPLAKGHTLIVPKEHHDSLATVPPATAARMMEFASKIATALVRTVGADGYNLFVANGSCAGQAVQHVHLHIVPRHPHDGILLPARTVPYTDAAEKDDILNRTRKRLAPRP